MTIGPALIQLAKPVKQAGKSLTAARCPADDDCSIQATETRTEGRQDTRGEEKETESGEKPALQPLHTSRFMDTACWIPNSGNLQNPPVKSLLSFHFYSQLSNTITYAPLYIFHLFLVWSCPLFLPIIRYPLTESLLWQSQTVANFSLFAVTLNTQQCSTHSPHCGQFKHVHVHTHSRMHACTNSYEMY